MHLTVWELNSTMESYWGSEEHSYEGDTSLLGLGFGYGF